MIRSRRTGVAALVLAFAATAATADWLVLHDGTRIETRSAWKERGGLVVFHLPSGTLSSLPRAEVDLETSRQATVEAEERRSRTTEPEPQIQREPILVLTDRDVAHVDPEDLAASSALATASSGDAVPAEAEPASDLTVTGWDWTAKADPAGIEITGTLRNTSQDVAANLVLRVLLLDDEGGMAGRATASLVRAALQPGQTTAFTAFFPGIYDFSTPRFETQSSMILRRPETAPVPDEE